jgi:hypothetical protein
VGIIVKKVCATVDLGTAALGACDLGDVRGAEVPNARTCISKRHTDQPVGLGSRCAHWPPTVDVSSSEP